MGEDGQLCKTVDDFVWLVVHNVEQVEMGNESENGVEGMRGIRAHALG
jgi:hypothetical protein